MKTLRICGMLITAFLLSPVFVACNKDDDSPEIDGNKLNGHEFVDLGLPSKTKWATCNLGATTPYEVGSKYAWGETSAKTQDSWENYMTKEGFKFNYEGYNINVTHDPLAGYVYPNNKSIAGTEYDAATVNWGKGWTIPTSEQVEELITKCRIYYIKEDGSKHCEFVGPNGNSIILPVDNEGECIYWTSSPNTGDAIYADCYWIELKSNKIGLSSEYRYYIELVRPVTK